MGTAGRDPRNNHYPVGWFSVGCSYRPFRYNSWHDAVAGPMAPCWSWGLHRASSSLAVIIIPGCACDAFSAPRIRRMRSSVCTVPIAISLSPASHARRS